MNRSLNRHSNACIRSVKTKNTNYVPAGYYDYPQLRDCWGFSSIELKYTRNYMNIKILPHSIVVKRRLHAGDKIICPDSVAMSKMVQGNSGKDLAILLHKLDKTPVVPKMSLLKYLYSKLMKWIKNA